MQDGSNLITLGYTQSSMKTFGIKSEWNGKGIGITVLFSEQKNNTDQEKLQELITYLHKINFTLEA